MPHRFLSGLALIILLSACHGASPVNPRHLREEGHYWQRASATESIYMRGPKAQQMLHRDISRCVTELKEVQRLGTLRAAMPARNIQNDPTLPERLPSEWDTPERQGFLRAEHSDYHDFESCMIAKGWERVEYLPYDVAIKSRATYIETVTGKKASDLFVPKVPDADVKKKKDDDWSNLN